MHIFLLLNAVIETLLNAACHQSRSLRGKVRSGPSLLLPLIVESANNFPAVRLWHGVSGILRWGNLQSFANDLSNPGQEGDSLFLAEVSCNIHKRHSSMQPLTNVSCYCFIFVPQVAAIVCCLGVDSSGCRESAPPGCCFFFCLFFLNASQESVRREANLGPLPHCVSATVSHVSPPKNTVRHHHW